VGGGLSYDPMPFSLWFVVAGGVLTLMALGSTVLARLPLSSAQVYLLVGVAIGPLGVGLLRVDPLAEAEALERVTEVALILSLFAAGLKLRTPLTDGRWRLPLRLAVVSMALTVGLVAAVGVWGLGLGLGAAVLLGAVLAPTDPVLAGDVQVEEAGDMDRLRFGLTGEAGLNDGSAFPFVMLGLGLMGLHELGPSGLTWLGVDVVWAVAGGIGIGAALGFGVGHLVLYLRRIHKEAGGTDEYLALGLVALSYGLALLAHTYAFLAVFAAGVALRFVERRHTGEKASDEVVELVRGGTDEAAVHEEAAPAVMAHTVLGFTEQIDRIGAVAVVVLTGALVHLAEWSWASAAFIAAFFLVLRPVAVWIGLLGSATSGVQRGLTGWFGVRGIGSLYYLFYAVAHGVAGPVADRLLGLVLAVVAVSAVVHGVSVTPAMRWYGRRAGREERIARAV
jgi:NhaP-type Na+/H+ or K+/H+ antiporter